MALGHGFVGWPLFLLAALLAGPGARSAPAQHPDPSDLLALDPRIWTGEVKIQRTGSAEIERDDSHGNNIRTYSLSRQVSDSLTLKACGIKGALFVISAERALSDRKEENSFRQNARQLCDPPVGAERNRPERKEPGNSERSTETTVVELYQGRDAPRLRITSGVFLEVRPGGQYVLAVDSRAHTTMLSDTVKEEKFVCKDETRRLESHIRTCGLYDTPTVQSNRSGEGNNSTTVSWTTLNPGLMTAGVHQQGQLEGDGFSGTGVVKEIKPRKEGEYRETTTASWSFNARNPCAEVYQQLTEDLAFAEAYSLRSIQDFAGSIEEYEALVDQRAYKIVYGDAPPRDLEKLTDVDAGVESKTGEPKGLDALWLRLAESCRHPIIFESIEAHERAHQRQHKKYGAEIMNSRNPHYKGPLELEAYLVGIGQLTAFLKDYCPDTDLSGPEQRLEKLRTLDRNRGW